MKKYREPNEDDLDKRTLGLSLQGLILRRKTLFECHLHQLGGEKKRYCQGVSTLDLGFCQLWSAWDVFA